MRSAAIVTAVVFWGLGCSATPGAIGDGKRCAPGQQVACACPKGAVGAQVCTPEGAGFTKCECSGGGGDGGASGGPWAGGSSGGGGSPSAGGSSGGPVGGSSGGGGSAGGFGGAGSGGGQSGGSGGSSSGGSGAGGSSAGGTTGGGGWGGAGGWSGGSFGPVGDYAGNVNITEIAIYQGVKVSLVKNGQEVAQRNAPVVVDRPGLLRVSVAPGAGFSSRALTALLDLKSADPAVKPQTVSMTVSSASTDGNLASTFNFMIPPEQMKGDIQLKVSLHEPSGASVGSVQNGVAFPAQGSLALGAEGSGPVRLTIVPFKYNADGSGRLPDTSDQQMKIYHDIVFAMYPTSKVELNLHAAVDYNYYVGPSSGWSSWLDTLCDIRSADKVDPKVYYFGIMAPKSSWSSYGGGIAGLGNVPDANGNWGRCAVGLGFQGADPNGLIMAHELGHTHGRPHAPCGVSGEAFPYSGAKTGVWGHSLVSNTLMDPGSYRDVMSYCDPQWISDVNYTKLFKRIRYINQSFFMMPQAPKRYRKLLVDTDGSLSWGGAVDLEETPTGQAREVTLLGLDGNPTGTVTGTFMPFSEDPAGVLMVPEPGPAVFGIAPTGMPAVVLPPSP